MYPYLLAKDNQVLRLYLILGSAVALFIGVTAYRAGASSVQAAWDKANQKNTGQVVRKQERIAEAKDTYHVERQQIVASAVAADKQTSRAIAEQRVVYERRLLDSTTRAAEYRRMSEACSIESINLVDHAARLDRTLEEGRQLVYELRATLGLREEEIKLLAAHIQNDHTLFATE